MIEDRYHELIDHADAVTQYRSLVAVTSPFWEMAESARSEGNAEIAAFCDLECRLLMLVPKHRYLTRNYDRRFHGSTDATGKGICIMGAVTAQLRIPVPLPRQQPPSDPRDHRACDEYILTCLPGGCRILRQTTYSAIRYGRCVDNRAYHLPFESSFSGTRWAVVPAPQNGCSDLLDSDPPQTKPFTCEPGDLFHLRLLPVCPLIL